MAHGEPDRPLAAAARSVELTGQFEDFFRANYKDLVKFAMTTGATLEEAEDAVEEAMDDIQHRWTLISKPLAYARRAIVSILIKERVRDRERLPRSIKGGHYTPEANKTDLTELEDKEWVLAMLRTLPPEQQATMAVHFDNDDYTSEEIGVLLGKSPAAVRKNLQLARDKLKVAVEAEREQERDVISGPMMPRKEAP